MSIRYRVGIDTLNYIEYYKYIIPYGDISFSEILQQYEPLSYLLQSIAKLFSDEFYLFQTIHVTLLNILIARFIIKNTKYILSALFFYFLISVLYFNTEILRESLAVAVFINAYSYIQSKKWIKYYFCVLVAIGFHMSAVITLFIPLIRRLKINWIYVIGLCAFTICLAIFSRQLTFIVLLFDSHAAEKILGYLSDKLTFGWTMLVLIRQSIFPFFFIIIYKLNKIKFRHENMLGAYIITGIGSIFLPIIFSRFANYFVFFYILFLAEFLPNLRFSKNRAIYAGCLFCFCLYTLYVDYFRPIGSERQYSRWYPYYSMFDEKMDSVREAHWNH